MEKIGFNMAVSDFRASIISRINGNGLPATVTLYVLKDIIRDVEAEAERVTRKEIEEYNQRKEKEHGQNVHDVPVGERAVGQDAAEPEAIKSDK